MRVIKFRGKRVDNDEWVYGNLVIKIINGEKVYYISGQENGKLMVSIYPETVGQFTGLHDKKGKEIFEGDVVEQEIDRFSKWIGQIVYDREGFKRIMIPNRCKARIEDDCEIIGNIHDNHEMLGGIDDK